MKIFLLSALTLLINTWLFATIITVDNSVPSMGNYSTLQSAYDVATNGDTLYLYPSMTPFTAISMSKKLILIGAGFKAPQAGVKFTKISGTMTMAAGSDGSVINGFGGGFEVIIDANIITIKRNLINNLKILQNHYGNAIIQNYIKSEYSGYNIEIQGQNEVLISNNIIRNYAINQMGPGLFVYSGKGIRANQLPITITIRNNVIDLFLPAGNWGNGYDIAMDLGSSNASVINNIIISGSIYGLMDGYFYNMGWVYPAMPGANFNINNADRTSVFVDFQAEDYHLKPGSPALGAGQNGSDMGAYGGDFPFVDYGYPEIPVIYFLEVPTVGTQQEGLDIRVKARSNN